MNPHEVIDFFLAKTILSGAIQAPLDDVVVEDNFDTAVARANGLEVETQFFDRGLEVPDDYLTWNDIRALESSELGFDFDRQIYQDLTAQIQNNFRSCIPAFCMEAADNIVADFFACIQSRLTTTPSPFFEALFSLYQRGAWPCGWEGDYPEGRFVVFRPNTELY